MGALLCVCVVEFLTLFGLSFGFFWGEVGWFFLVDWFGLVLFWCLFLKGLGAGDCAFSCLVGLGFVFTRTMLDFHLGVHGLLRAIAVLF